MTALTLLLAALLMGTPPAVRSARAAAHHDVQHFEQIRIVCLDPGHGGVNPGALTSVGTYEKEHTLAFAKAVRDHLAKRTDLEVVLTRETDASLTLPERVAIANRVGADLFLSLHLNSTEGIIAQGVETYFLTDDASDEEAALVAARENLAPELDDPLLAAQQASVDRIVASLVLRGAHLLASPWASHVQRAMVREGGLRDRGVKSARFGVLRGLEMPGVVLELGFASNPDEMERLLEPDYPAAVARAVLDALTRTEQTLAGR